MRISAKGRYALAALIEIAKRSAMGKPVPLASIAGNLNVSKIFLEQIASALKKNDVITSHKGIQGGYRLTKEPRNITVLEALQAVETALFENIGDDALEGAPAVSSAISMLVFKPLDIAVKESLACVSIQDLVDYAQNQGENQSFMLYI